MRTIHKLLIILLLVNGVAVLSAKPKPTNRVKKTIEQRVDSVLKLMTLEEKIGQMTQVANPNVPTGPTYTSVVKPRNVDLTRAGKLGSILNIAGADITRKMQEVAVNESRMKIPLLFGFDVIHGFKTVFPIPLASACSWDMAAIESAERVAALESSVAGLHWTFAPMVDIARDPRWGRIAEGAGEDPYLGSQVAKARVRGFQGKSLADNGSILACVKHFAAYGNAEAGRDYNTTDMSERLLREIYLPPYKAAIDAGVATVMSSFNEFNGTPASGNKFLLTDILRNEYGFKGFVVSDWNSIGEIVTHGAAKDKGEATIFAMNANIDMDMENRCYPDTLKQLVESGKINVEQVNMAVRRILRAKFELGLFENPYKYCDVQKEKSVLLSKENLTTALDVAKRSIVLLKNNNVLPLSKTVKVAVVGPNANVQSEMNGCWAWYGDQSPVSFLQGIKNKIGSDNVTYAKGCNINDDKTDSIAYAVSMAKKADVVVLCVGESANMSGEANCRTSLELPGMQTQLIAEILKTGKPVVLVLTNGRPITLGNINDSAPSILETWFLGTRAGDALAEVLFGDYNPSGKLAVTFPITLGQVPIYYNHKNTGRPNLDGKLRGYNSRYIDCGNEPQYPFGFGLSYTRFEYSDLKLDKTIMAKTEKATVSITVRNSGNYDGEEVVQLYIRDLVAYGVSRPVKELKGFEKITLKKGEQKTVSFSITPEMLEYYDLNLKKIVEPGDFAIMVGSSSADKDLQKLKLTIAK